MEPNQAGKSFNEAKDQVEALGEATKANAASFAGQAADAARSAMGSAQDTFDAAKQKVESLSGDLPGAMAQALDAGQRGGQEIARRVSKQPLETVLLAGALGYLLAWLLHRR